jgi:hypothetical protein
MRQPISCRFMSSAAFFTVAFGSMVITFSTMICLSFCDIGSPCRFHYSFVFVCFMGC